MEKFFGRSGGSGLREWYSRRLSRALASPAKELKRCPVQTPGLVICGLMCSVSCLTFGKKGVSWAWCVWAAFWCNAAQRSIRRASTATAHVVIPKSTECRAAKLKEPQPLGFLSTLASSSSSPIEIPSATRTTRAASCPASRSVLEGPRNMTAKEASLVCVYPCY